MSSDRILLQRRAVGKWATRLRMFISFAVLVSALQTLSQSVPNKEMEPKSPPILWLFSTFLYCSLTTSLSRNELDAFIGLITHRDVDPEGSKWDSPLCGLICSIWPSPFLILGIAQVRPRRMRTVSEKILTPPPPLRSWVILTINIVPSQPTHTFWSPFSLSPLHQRCVLEKKEINLSFR